MTFRLALPDPSIEAAGVADVAGVAAASTPSRSPDSASQPPATATAATSATPERDLPGAAGTSDAAAGVQPDVATAATPATPVADVAGVAVAPSLDLRAQFAEALQIGLQTGGARGLVCCSSCTHFRELPNLEADGSCTRYDVTSFAHVPFKCPGFERAAPGEAIR